MLGRVLRLFWFSFVRAIAFSVARSVLRLLGFGGR